MELEISFQWIGVEPCSKPKEGSIIKYLCLVQSPGQDSLIPRPGVKTDIQYTYMNM